MPPSFPRLLPPSRLGRSHPSLPSFLTAVYGGDAADDNLDRPPRRAGRKHYSLIVVTDTSSNRILLGLKHHGFGKGLYNSFGGKVEKNETPVQSAVRELHEEANILVPLETMERASVGTLHFTFADQDDFEMLVNLFRIDLVALQDDNYMSGGDQQDDLSNRPLVTASADLSQIKGCDEITPEWFSLSGGDPSIPFDNMFCDDTIWYPILLSARRHIQFDGYFHFNAAIEHLTCLHYHLAMKEADNAQARMKGYSLEKRLFHELHDNNIHSPSIKEFKESWAFAQKVVGYYGKDSIDQVIDVAGGHGALAALLLILTTAKEGVVVDPAVVGGRKGVKRAWGQFYKGQELSYRDECLRTGLPAELENSLAKTDKTRILVVACHACQHLSEETVEIATSFGVQVAVTPCCQKDRDGGAWKALGKQMGIGIGPLMDILLAGKAMSASCGKAANVSYSVKMKLIDERITPQNRLIMCKADILEEGQTNDCSARNILHGKLERAYIAAHRNKSERNENMRWNNEQAYLCTLSALVGLCAGVALARRK